MSNLSSQFDPFDFTTGITFKPHGEGWVPQQHEETGEEIAGAHKTFGELILPDLDLPELDQLRIPMSAMQWSDHTGQPSRTYKLEAFDEYGTSDPEALDQAGQRLLAPPIMRTVVTRPQSGIGDGPNSNVTAMAQAMGGPGSQLRTWGANWKEGRWDNPPGPRWTSLDERWDVEIDDRGYSWADGNLRGAGSWATPHDQPEEGSRSSWANQNMRDLYRFYRDELEKFRGAHGGGYFDAGTGAQDFGEEEPEETETAKQIKGAFSGIGEAILAATTRAAMSPEDRKRELAKRERSTIKMDKPEMDKPEMEIDSGQPETVDERHPVTGIKTGRKVVKDAPYFEKPPPPKRERPTIKMKPNRQARADKKTYDEEGTGSQDFDQRMEKFDDMWPSEGSLTHGDPRLDKHARTMWAAGGIRPGTDLEDMRQEITRRYPRAFPNDV